MFKKLAAFFLVLFLYVPAYAEEVTEFDPKGTWWVNLGVGAPATSLTSHIDDVRNESSDKTPLQVALSFNYAHFSNQFVELRTSTIDRFIDFSCSAGCEDQLNGLWEVGLLYGLMKKEKWYTVGIAAGLSYTELDYKTGEFVYVPDGDYYTTEYSHRYSETIGFPFEAQLFFTPLKYLGIGLIGSMTLNTEAYGAGLMLAIQLGNLRP